MARRNPGMAEQAGRLGRHRRKLVAAGAKRLEVTVPAQDVALIRGLAAKLRTGGDDAKCLRESLQSLVEREKAVTGSDLIAFFRRSPLVGLDLEFERDKTTGRKVDL